MIDQDLIDINTSLVSKSINDSVHVSSVLKLISNPFDQKILEKFTKFVDENFDSDIWTHETTAYGQAMDVPRYKLSWQAESVIEELHEVCQAQKSVIEQLFDKQFGPFRGIVIWRDHEDYSMSWHKDNPVIAASMQIYMYGDKEVPGTRFKFDSFETAVPFVPNTGYVVDQSDDSRPLHKVDGVVPKNSVRYSLFAIWDHLS